MTSRRIVGLGLRLLAPVLAIQTAASAVALGSWTLLGGEPDMVGRIGGIALLAGLAWTAALPLLVWRGWRLLAGLLVRGPHRRRWAGNALPARTLWPFAAGLVAFVALLLALEHVTALVARGAEAGARDVVTLGAWLLVALGFGVGPARLLRLARGLSAPPATTNHPYAPREVEAAARAGLGAWYGVQAVVLVPFLIARWIAEGHLAPMASQWAGPVVVYAVAAFLLLRSARPRRGATPPYGVASTILGGVLLLKAIPGLGLLVARLAAGERPWRPEFGWPPYGTLPVALVLLFAFVFLAAPPLVARRQGRRRVTSLDGVFG